MKLMEKLETLPNDTIVHIGARSSYFFIGTVDEFKEDADLLNKVLIERHKNAMKSMYYQMVAIIKDCEERHKLETKKAYCRRVTARMKMIQTICKRINTKADAITNHIDVRQREVIDEYPRISDEGICLIVSGVDMGSFWFKEERQKWRTSKQ